MADTSETKPEVPDSGGAKPKLLRNPWLTISQPSNEEDPQGTPASTETAPAEEGNVSKASTSVHTGGGHTDVNDPLPVEQTRSVDIEDTGREINNDEEEEVLRKVISSNENLRSRMEHDMFVTEPGPTLSIPPSPPRQHRSQSEGGEDGKPKKQSPTSSLNLPAKEEGKKESGFPMKLAHVSKMASDLKKAISKKPWRRKSEPTKSEVQPPLSTALAALQAGRTQVCVSVSCASPCIQLIIICFCVCLFLFFRNVPYFGKVVYVDIFV